ncbi:toxin of the YeeV-YeeU toxin-antitoxin system; CP4-44 prophage [Enterobacter cancerogenus]|uniref:TA system toxin CbtA family protein n=1 Tax=Enterobacter cancerogenus TaxID=69218 RepID=UPI0019256FF2|nr:TA system toxin CbtA family protein [Enterobacter cancerogenus]CAD5358552.1 toxin of the YeeV-YeeU toxin-antitoxin system; CP4-44 prophage [Enterobacter cancerogenus]
MLPAITTRKAQSRPTPVEIWRQLLTYLLERHYGLSLHDTKLGDGNVIQQYIDAGLSLADALNFLVEKSELVRIDCPGFSIHHQSPFISAIDILRARKATGLMQRTGYKAVTCAISGRSSGGPQ